jgi:hypothetical protein
MRLLTDFGSIVYAGPYVTAFLTNIYLAKFFAWETGYFNTLDITLDRGGFYLCWGCLCWVQVFYTFTSLFMVGHPSKVLKYRWWIFQHRNTKFQAFFLIWYLSATTPGSHQAVERQLSSICQAVVRKSSGSRQAVFIFSYYIFNIFFKNIHKYLEEPQPVLQ